MIPPDSSTPIGSLPLQLTPFVGREHEVAEIVAMLCREDVRLVTLTGPGGVGKTRLAIASADRAAHCFPDGVSAIELAPVTDPALVPIVIGEALGVRGGDDPIHVRLATRLHDRRMLLVLDNFEQVISAAPLISHLLAECPQITVLVTSRESLKISGEREYPVSPLPMPNGQRTSIEQLRQFDAIRLFVDRAAAVDPGFTLSPVNADVVARICHQVDGLPLAIELAAARIKTLPPAALLERLEQRLPLLSGARRDLPERQQTMRGAIAWSHDLLSEDERTLFRRLSVFVGGCTLEAAEAVIDGPLDVLDGITSLVDKSLLRRDPTRNGEVRFSMLETIREFAWERVTQCCEETETQQRHAEWALALAERIDTGLRHVPTPDQVAAAAVEHDNLRAALAWFDRTGNAAAMLRMVSALGGFWWACSHHAEGYRWLERALKLGKDLPPALRAPTVATAGMFAYYLGNAARGKELVRSSLALYGPDTDPWYPAHARFVLGGITLGEGDYAAAIPDIESALRVFESLGDRKWVGLLKHLYGVACFGQGDVPRSLELLNRALAIQREQGDVWGTGLTLDYIGLVRGTSGGTNRAVATLRESQAIWQAFGTTVKVSDWLMRVAVVTAAAASPERIARLIGAAETIRESLQSVWELPERAIYERTIATTRAALGPDAYTAAHAAGADLSPDAAWQLGLETLADVDRPVHPAPPAESVPFGLTPREIDVLRLLVAGKSDRDIADQLFISPRTAQTHVANVLAKMNVGNRAEAAVLAVKAGIQ